MAGRQRERLRRRKRGRVNSYQAWRESLPAKACFILIGLVLTQNKRFLHSSNVLKNVPGTRLYAGDNIYNVKQRQTFLALVNTVVWKGGQSYGCNYKMVINVTSEGFSEEKLLELRLDRWVGFNLVNRVMRLIPEEHYRQNKWGKTECGASEQPEEMGGATVTRKVDMVKRRWPSDHGMDFSSVLILKQREAIKDNFKQNFIIAPSRFFCTKYTKRKHRTLNENNFHESSNIVYVQHGPF